MSDYKKSKKKLERQLETIECQKLSAETMILALEDAANGRYGEPTINHMVCTDHARDGFRYNTLTTEINTLTLFPSLTFSLVSLYTSFPLIRCIPSNVAPLTVTTVVRHPCRTPATLPNP